MRSLSIAVFLLIIVQIVTAQTGCPAPSIYGKLSYDNIQNTPMNISTVYLSTLSGVIVDSCFTYPNGSYIFCNVPIGNYKLTAKTKFPWGGVNTADGLIAQKFFVQLLSLTGLKLKAGDVNSSSYINSIDALMITKRFSQLISTFTIGDWVFEEPQVSVSGNLSQNINLKALCSGDLNASYIPVIQTTFNCGDTLLDQRDSQKYPTVQIGSQCWFRRNLNIGTFVISTGKTQPHSDCAHNGIVEKYCYNNDTSLCNEYGGLYDWDEMMQYDTTQGTQGICPLGWHIPTDSEWCTMTNYLDPTVDSNIFGWSGTIIGCQMKEPGTNHWQTTNSGITNTSGFTAIGTGNRTRNGFFGGFKYNNGFWTSSALPSNHIYIIRSLVHFLNTIARGPEYDPELGFSVRCLKD